jgi:hypothetical protein
LSVAPPAGAWGSFVSPASTGLRPWQRDYRPSRGLRKRSRPRAPCKERVPLAAETCKACRWKPGEAIPRLAGLSTQIHKYGNVCGIRPEAGILSTGFTGWPGFERESTNLWAISRSAPAFGGALAWPKLIRLKTGRTGFKESSLSCSSCQAKIGSRICESEH